MYSHMYIILININLSYLNEKLKKSWNQDVIMSATYPMGWNDKPSCNKQAS